MSIIDNLIYIYGIRISMKQNHARVYMYKVVSEVGNLLFTSSVRNICRAREPEWIHRSL